MVDTCEAVLKHIHGTSRCEEKLGHNGKHRGRCWACVEDGEEDTVLSWVEGDEET